MSPAKPPLTLLIAAPRGFCAGVDRAIRIVELAIERFGPPVYVRHEIVHNKFVVDDLKARGAVFVKELDEVPDGVPVVFSAHGVPKIVPATAEQRGLAYVDATCPLVSKVHRQAERHVEQGRHILFVGHAGHPEVIGTFGQVPEGRMTLVETAVDAERIDPPQPPRVRGRKLLVMAVTSELRRQRGGHAHRHVEQHLRHAFAQRVEARRRRAAAGQRVVQHQVHGRDARQVIAIDAALHQVGEVLLHRLRRDALPQQRQPFRAPCDEADVGEVALVATARPGQLH